MKKEIEYINLKNISEYIEEPSDIFTLTNLSKNKDLLIKILEKSLKIKDYKFNDCYYYDKLKGSIRLCEMNRLHRLNAFNYFSENKKLIAKDYKELISDKILNKDIKCNLSIDLNPKSYDDFDILCRVYRNQNQEYWNQMEKDRDETEQICSEVLFRKGINIDHQRATCWLPRGAAAFIGQELNKIKNKNYKVGIFNELDDNIGVLTSCRRNFEYAIEHELKNLK